MQIMNFGRTPRDENQEEVEGKKDGGNEEPQLFDIQNTLKRAMSKMLEESLDLTRKSSKQAQEAKSMSAMKRRYESNEKFQKVVQK